MSMEVERLTYRELADRLGVKPESARKTAQRKRWKRDTGNDGLARVTVPIEALQRAQEVPEDAPADVAADSHALRELEGQIGLLKELVAAERRRADAAEADRDAWRSQAQRGVLRRLFG
jgi:predicted  nucleic acid-binding Zn-ribbon protein